MPDKMEKNVSFKITVDDSQFEELVEHIKARQSELNDTLSTTDKAFNLLSSKIDNISGQYVKLAAATDLTSDSFKTLNKHILSLERNINIHEKVLDDLVEHYENISQNINNAWSEIAKGSASGIASLKTNIEAHGKIIDDLTTEYADLYTDISTIWGLIANSVGNIDEDKLKNIEVLGKAIQSLNDQVDKLGNIKDIRNSIRSLVKTIDQIKGESINKIESLTVKINALGTGGDTLKNKTESLKNIRRELRNLSKSLDSLTDDKLKKLDSLAEKLNSLEINNDKLLEYLRLLKEIGFKIDKIDEKQVKNKVKQLGFKDNKPEDDDGNINRASNIQNLIMSKAYSMIPMSSMLKAIYKDLESAIPKKRPKNKNNSTQVEKASKNTEILYNWLTKTNVLLPLIIAGIIGAVQAGQDATIKLANMQSNIRSLGGSLGDLGTNAIEAENKTSRLKETLATIKDDIYASLIEPFESLIDVGYATTKNIKDFLDSFVDFKWTPITGIIPEFDFSKGIQASKELNDKVNANINGASKTVIDFAQTVEDEFGTSLKKSISYMTGIANTFRGTGLSNQSLANMSQGIYAGAYKLQNTYGGNIDDIVNSLTQAISTGGTQASKYGLVLDDATLNGWLAMEKGIDGVNVQMSDAMRQSYRYQLALYQMNNTGTDGLQQQIAGWKKYGNIIDATKGKVYQFDEVINMGAYNFDIPEIGPSGLDFKTSDGEDVEDKAKNTTDKIVGLNDELDNTGKVGAESALAIQEMLDSLNVLGVDGALAAGAVAESLVPVTEGAYDAMEAFGLATQQLAQLSGVADGLVNKKISFDVNTSGITSAQKQLQSLLGNLNTLSVTVPELKVNTSGIKSALNGLPMLPTPEPTGVIASGGMLRFPGLQTGAKSNILYNATADKQFGTDIISALEYDIQHILDGNLLSRGAEYFKDMDTGSQLAVGGSAAWLGGSALYKILASAPGLSAAAQPQLQALLAKLSSLKASGSVAVGNVSNALTDFEKSLGSKASGGGLLLGATANGGLSLREHLTAISEGNRPEIVLPLSNPSVNVAYQKIAENISGLIQSGGLSGLNISIELAPGGTVVAGEYSLNQFVNMMADRLAIELRNRGELGYGTVN